MAVFFKPLHKYATNALDFFQDCTCTLQHVYRFKEKHNISIRLLLNTLELAIRVMKEINGNILMHCTIVRLLLKQ